MDLSKVVSKVVESKTFSESCFKALYKRSSDQLLSRSTQYKAFYRKKNVGNAIFNIFAKSTTKICQ